MKTPPAERETGELGLNPEDLIPLTQSNFRVDQIAKMFCCSKQHIFSLIAEGEIAVPQERIDSAPSRASILVPRASLVDFVRRRSSTAWLKARRVLEDVEKAKQKNSAEVRNTPARMTRKRKELSNANLSSQAGH